MPEPGPRSDVPDPVTAVEAARSFERLALAFETLFVDVGGWVRACADPVAAVALATVSRRLGEQAVAWRALVPESVLLADARASASAQGPVWGPAGAPSADSSDGERVQHLRQVLAGLATDTAALAARLSPVADGAALRQAAVLALDLAAADRALAGSAGPATTDG